MRFAMFVAAISAACVAVPASAQTMTIIQTGSEFTDLGFLGFNSALGTLTRVNVEVNVSKTRGWQLLVPEGTASTRTVGWTVNGPWYGIIPLTLTGSGTSVVQMVGSNSTVGQYGYFTVAATASGSADLDVSQYIDRARFYLNGVDPGYFDLTPSDTTFTMDADSSLRRFVGQCTGTGVTYMEDDCGSVTYKLTYEYTPSAVSGVPEPATWGMMLVGFGAIGAGLRRRSHALHVMS